jgi:hypothetical protein
MDGFWYALVGNNGTNIGLGRCFVGFFAVRGSVLVSFAPDVMTYDREHPSTVRLPIYLTITEPKHKNPAPLKRRRAELDRRAVR